MMPGPGLDEAKKKKKKQPFSRTYRFNLSLDLPANGKTHYPDFNWLDLVAQEEESRIEAKRKEVLDPYASDDDDQLKAMARKFEEKYGNTTEKIRQKKKTRKLDDYADLGYGYDSNDPFIDNSDVHDEIVPENLTTAHGGFYVNCGPLEFKARESADEDSDVEAVLAESEKATQKRKYKTNKVKNSCNQEQALPKKKAKESSQTVKSSAAAPSVPSSQSPMAIKHNPNLPNGEIKKPRARKEGSKPLGRPKKRNPDGTLVHPPKPKKADKVQPNNSSNATTTIVPTPKVPSAAANKDHQKILDQQREELLQKQLLEQVQEMQRRQEEYMKEQQKQTQKLLAEKKAAEEAEKKRKEQQQKFIEQQKQQMLAQQRQMKELEQQQLKQQQEQQRLKLLKEEQNRIRLQQEQKQKLLREQQEQQRLKKEQEKARLLKQQAEEHQKRLQEEQQRRLREQQEQQRRLQQQKEAQERLLKQQKEQERLLQKQQEEQNRRLQQQKEQQEQQRRLKEQQEQQRRLQQQKEAQERLLKQEQEEQKRRLQQQHEQKLLKQQQEQQRLLQQEQENRRQQEQRLLMQQQQQQRLSQMSMQQPTTTQQQQRLPSSLSIQSLSGKSNQNTTTMPSAPQQQQPPTAQQLLQRLQSPYNSGNYNKTSTESLSVQMTTSNTNVSLIYPTNVGVTTATKLSPQQSQQQQKLQHSQQYNNKMRQKSPAQIMNPVQSSANFTSTEILTPENASQMLATMQPQPPSSLSSYFKQTSPSSTSTTYGQTLVTTKSPTTPVSRPPHQRQYVSPQRQQPQQQSPKTQCYFVDSTALANNPRNQTIRLPTVPVPTTSMLSSMSPVISQATATQNYLFTSLPQHSAQPNFDVAMLQAKSINSGRIPVTAANESYQQFLNMPK